MEEMLEAYAGAVRAKDVDAFAALYAALGLVALAVASFTRRA